MPNQNNCFVLLWCVVGWFGYRLGFDRHSNELGYAAFLQFLTLSIATCCVHIWNHDTCGEGKSRIQNDLDNIRRLFYTTNDFAFWTTAFMFRSKTSLINIQCSFITEAIVVQLGMHSEVSMHKLCPPLPNQIIWHLPCCALLFICILGKPLYYSSSIQDEPYYCIQQWNHTRCNKLSQLL